MSTKSHVLLNSETEIYEETIEAKHIFGNFKGYNIYAMFDMDIISLFKMDNNNLFIHFKEGSETANALIPEMKFWLNDIESIEIDADGLMIVFKGDGLFSPAWSRKFYKAFSPLYKYDYNDFKNT